MKKKYMISKIIQAITRPEKNCADDHALQTKFVSKEKFRINTEIVQKVRLCLCKWVLKIRLLSLDE